MAEPTRVVVFPPPPLREPLVARPTDITTETWQRWLDALYARIQTLEARVAALEGP